MRKMRVLFENNFKISNMSFAYYFVGGAFGKSVETCMEKWKR